MSARAAFEQIRAYAAEAAKAYPASPNVALIQEVCERMLAALPASETDAQAPAIVWAAWHPRHGFAVPHQYEGAVAYADLDPVAREVRDLNKDDKTTNRNGWRAAKATLVKVPS